MDDTQPAAQQPSASPHCVIGWLVQAALQLVALPVSTSSVHALLSLHDVGHEAPSHVSPASTAPLPQVGEQSASLVALQPGAQQPSPSVHWVMPWNEHAALQLAAEPTSVSIVHATLSLHVVGHDPPSQVSPGSTMSLPQLGEQSLSLIALHPAAQQPSLLWHSVIVWNEHAALQFAADPTSVSIVHAAPSLHVVGQFSPSHVSPDSTKPLPQVGEQSVSLSELQPGAQQPSPLWHALIGWNVHAALHVDAEPASTSSVHALPSEQVSGHDGPSQVSPGDCTVSPQNAEQSLSFATLQPAGQQPSPL